MEVLFTGPAEEQLKKIYCHYPESVAEELVEKILLRAETLAHFADRGRIVEELRFMDQGHRFVLERNYKIIYRQLDDKIYVTDVFAMHQNPESIIKRHEE